MLIVITIMIFVVTMALLLSTAYFLIEAPAARRRMRVRLESIGQAEVSGDVGFETSLFRDEVLSNIPALNRLLLHLPFVSRMKLYLAQGAVTLPLGTILLISMALFLAGMLITTLAGTPPALSMIVGVLIGIIPFGAVSLKRRSRFRKFEEQFPDAMDLLARAVRAGHAFTTGFTLIGSEMPEPVAGEFRTTFEQQNLGMPIVQALRNLSIRMPLSDVRIFVAALAIQRESGGNLGEILDNLSAVIRDRFKILRQVQVFTAEGRLTLYILTAMPFASGLLMYFTNPDYMARLFKDPLGQKAITVALIMQALGYLIIRKIVRIKV